MESMSEGLMVAFLSGGSAAFFTGLFSVISFFVRRHAQKSDKQANHQDAIQSGVCMLLYDRLKWTAQKYIDRGYVTTEELRDFLAMHTVYHDGLGGNGYLDALLEALKELPLRK